MADRWIKSARKSMEKRHTVGKFGKATRSKIERGKHSRSLTKRREAIFAQNMKRIAAKRKRRHGKRRSHRGGRR